MDFSKLGLKALYLATAIVLCGNGMQNVFLVIYAKGQGFPLPLIGAMNSLYFIGFILGCWIGPTYLRNVGHIRTFSALASVAAGVVLLHALILQPTVWLFLRGITGFSIACLYLSIESWLNSMAKNEDRGRIVSQYRVADIAGTILGQWAFLIADPPTETLFLVCAFFVVISIVPITLTKIEPPTQLNIKPGSLRHHLKETWQATPISILGCVLSGFANGSYWTLAPLYVSEQFASSQTLTWVMSVYLLGGGLIQMPIGKFSDRVDRRKVIAFQTVLCMVAAIGITMATHRGGVSPGLFWLMLFVYGAGSMPIYALSIAHASDAAEGKNIVGLSSLLLIASSLGSAIGPFLGTIMVGWFTTQIVFLYLASAHALLFILTMGRITTRAPIPPEQKGEFINWPRTTQMITKLFSRSSK